MRALVLLICLFPVGIKAQLDFTKISDSSYIFTTYQTHKTRISSHGFLKLTSIGAIMIDTPWDTTQFQPLLDSVKLKFNLPVVFVLSTHWHEDRTAGLDYYSKKGIATYSTYATKNLCAEHHLPQAEFTFEGDTSFHIGTVFETFYPGAGHSSDNIVVYFPSDRLLVGGCFVKSAEAPDLGNLSDANIGMWRIAAKTLIKKYPKVKIVIPGHQEITPGKKALKHTLKLAKEKYKGRQRDKKKTSE
ncbi:subclass B1 metallo-beta-lactamase [Fluviicola sp.]|jgi:glyoxylase-like metal-dependent hydrolase (beta-lactamase superfamily II)|uniref:subclass B1 metallo-beta-lactamase n=1 Tax=Fluviicola sp. TaxID=1917219 RepID=UPI00281CD652|nr:subclass B1 metallo-beta-lactamase [Fluviicola sp.]MDR0802084.1 subclass B1 metallo-beta-lactamase [Fluviicola sp.]